MKKRSSKDGSKLNRLRELAREVGLESGVEALINAHSRSAESLPDFLERVALDDTQEVLTRLGGRTNSRPQEEPRDLGSSMVPSELSERLKRLAVVRECPVSEVLEDAVLQYLEAQERRFKA